jgi:hypothetical protein
VGPNAACLVIAAEVSSCIMRTMGKIAQDDTCWPLVTVHFPATASSDEDIEAHIADQRALLEKRRRFVQIIDASQAPVISARQRKRFSDWIKESEAMSRRYCLGLSTVVPNPIVRGAMQAVLWLVTPPMPVKMFGTLEECAEQCLLWLADANVEERERAEAKLRVLSRKRAS